MRLIVAFTVSVATLLMGEVLSGELPELGQCCECMLRWPTQCCSFGGPRNVVQHSQSDSVRYDGLATHCRRDTRERRAPCPRVPCSCPPPRYSCTSCTSGKWGLVLLSVPDMPLSTAKIGHSSLKLKCFQEPAVPRNNLLLLFLRSLLMLLSLMQAPSDSSDGVCCYGNSTTRLDCSEPFYYRTCYKHDMDAYNGRAAFGKCSDTPSPCDIGACCPPIDAYDSVCTDINSEKLFEGVRGACHFKGFTFFEGETCAQSCRNRNLGACCTKATPSSAPTCTPGITYKKCVGDHYNPDSTFLGFQYNKTCEEVDFAQYGACCSSERTSKVTSHGHAPRGAVALRMVVVTTSGLTLSKDPRALLMRDLIRPRVASTTLELAATRVVLTVRVLTKSAARLAATVPAMSASMLVRHATASATAQPQRMAHACRHLDILSMGRMYGHAFLATARQCASKVHRKYE
jgi:hypothetical protein